MGDRDAFIRAICETPEDDAPRLAFADWLAEHGEEARGEFIRLQIELARHPMGKGHFDLTCTWCRMNDCRVAELEDLVRGMLQDHGGEWARPMCNLINPMAPITGNELHWLGNIIFAWEWSRGFVEEVSVPVDRFLGPGCEGCYGNDDPPIGAGHANYRRSECPSCHGAGRTGVAYPLFSAHPIRAVRLTDRRPSNVRYMSGGIRRYAWFAEAAFRPGRPNRAILPVELMGERRRVNHHFEDEAVDWLSRTCVEYGRKLAGLPVRKPVKVRE